MARIEVQCSQCGGRHAVDAEAAGMPLTCPYCQAAMVAQDDPPEGVGADEEAGSGVMLPPAAAGNPVEAPRRERDVKKCPYCAEEILAEARKCRYCGEYLDKALRATHGGAEEAPAERPPARSTADATAESTQLEIHPVMFKNNPFGFILAVLLCVVGIGFLILLWWWLICRCTTLTVTDKRTILRRGLISKYTTEVYHEDIRNVQIGQSLFQRMFGVGYLGISSAGQSGVEIGVNGVTDPESIKELIDRYRRRQG